MINIFLYNSITDLTLANIGSDVLLHNTRENFDIGGGWMEWGGGGIGSNSIYSLPRRETFSRCLEFLNSKFHIP